MEEAVIAQWGAFGVILLVVAAVAAKLYMDLRASQNARVDDAKQVGKELRELQGEFNQTVSESTEASLAQTHAVNQLREENRGLREEVQALRTEIVSARGALDSLERRVDAMRRTR